MQDTLLTSEQVANRLGLKVDTIEKWRRERRGPAYVQLGRAIRYRPSAVEKFVAEREILSGHIST